MKYMGSKARHGSALLKAIQADLTFGPQCWLEPFVGGANMLDKVTAAIRLGNDVNGFVISMFKALQNGWIPPEAVSEGLYSETKLRSLDLANTNDPLIGFIGIGCSYAGKWFGGYARGNSNTGKPRNYCQESRDNLLQQRDKIQGVEFTSNDYRKISVPLGSVVYCDPPYAETTKYKGEFDTDVFWRWCDDLVTKGHHVYVSEYQAPTAWVCLWEKEVNNSLTKNTGSKRGLERLFTRRLN